MSLKQRIGKAEQKLQLQAGREEPLLIRFVWLSEDGQEEEIDTWQLRPAAGRARVAWEKVAKTGLQWER